MDTTNDIRKEITRSELRLLTAMTVAVVREHSERMKNDPEYRAECNQRIESELSKRFLEKMGKGF